MSLLRRELRIIKDESGPLERKLATALIVSTEFCKEIAPVYKAEYIQSPYVRTVARWALDYFRQYAEAPNREIETIYQAEKQNLKDTERELIESFLASISAEYERQEQFNWRYVLDKTLEYFRRRSLEVLFDRAKGLLSRGKLDAAEREVRSYTEVVLRLSGAEDPFKVEVVRDVLAAEKNVLFQLSGAVGELVGSLERDWLVGVIGSMKRGKSWMLQEIALQAMMSKLRVLFVSLEMSKEKITRRFYQQIVGKAWQAGEYWVPVMDCVKNQYGLCDKSERKSKKSALGEGERLDHPIQVRGYRPCTVCREDEELRGEFQPAVWWRKLKQREDLKIKEVERKVVAFNRMFGRSMRVVVYPTFTARASDVERELELLEQVEGFEPDVVVIDYADIFADEDRKLSERGNVDLLWKKLKRMASERHILVVTATQGNRRSIQKKVVEQVDVSEDIRKLAHVDVMVALNQTPEEKEMKYMRVGLLAHRHKDFSLLRQVLVLQQLDMGQVILDSEWEG